MSMASWRKKYYHVEANETAPSDALVHSIRKWQGLDRLSLSVHGLRRDMETICGWYYALEISSATCALCVHHLGEPVIKEDGTVHTPCGDCPLYAVRGGVACDRTRDDEDVSPYDAFTEFGDAAPMLRWLMRAHAETRPEPPPVPPARR